MREMPRQEFFHMINSLYSFYLFRILFCRFWIFYSQIRFQMINFYLGFVCFSTGYYSLSQIILNFPFSLWTDLSRIWFIRRMKSGIIYFSRWFICCVHFNMKMLCWVSRRNCDELIRWYLANAISVSINAFHLMMCLRTPTFHTINLFSTKIPAHRITIRMQNYSKKTDSETFSFRNAERQTEWEKNKLYQFQFSMTLASNGLDYPLINIDIKQNMYWHFNGHSVCYSIHCQLHPSTRWFI